MVVEKFDIEKKFIDNNEMFFECELPFPNFEIIHSSKYLGRCTCNFDENNNIVDVTIAISDSYDFTESQFDDVLLHEMIHYYLAWTKQDIYLSHGSEFKKMMKEFNKRYGTNINVVTNKFYLKRNKTNFISKLFSWF